MNGNTLSELERTVLKIIQKEMSKFSDELFYQLCNIRKYQIERTSYYSMIYPVIDFEAPLFANKGHLVCDVHIFRKKGLPIQALLHIKYGKVYLIETFCVDSGPLPENVDIERYEVVIST